MKPRYFRKHRASIIPEPLYGDEKFLAHSPLLHDLDVSDHEATDTGLIDKRGDTIMRAANPMGFVWEGD